MTQQGNAQGLSGRALAMARRKAMSEGGKKATGARASAPQPVSASVSEASPPAAAKASGASPARRIAPPVADGARAASLARRKALSSRGRAAAENKDRVRSAEARRKSSAVTGTETDAGCNCGCKEKEAGRAQATIAAPSPGIGRPKARAPRRNGASVNPGRAASLARRRAQSSRGKAGLSASGMSAAQTARATNPQLSGRELARALREQRSKRGSAGQKKSAPTGRQRPSRSTGKGMGPAQDQPWKVGAGETARGQTVTGTQVGRSREVTGDEASTCRNVTGTEYMGADIFRDFCQAEPTPAPLRAGSSNTGRGNTVTGNEVGRAARVTGNEPGTCKNVTGTEYVGAEQTEAHCGVKSEPRPIAVGSAETRKGKTVTGDLVGRSQRVTGNETGADRQLTGTQYTQLGDAGAPPKVGVSATLRGGSVTGTMVGRREKMTGDEPGSCRNITGDDYVGREQYGDFCQATPAPGDRKVGVSRTLGGESVTGTMTGRSSRVTGDEPGTCKSVTGTPYAGAEQYVGFCEPAQAESAAARMGVSKRAAGAPLTGTQPSVGGAMTGDARGACETVSGTHYLGMDQQSEACPNIPPPAAPMAMPGDEPWGEVGPAASEPGPAAPAAPRGVTGTGYDQGRITGPFGMASGKVTGTEEARFGRGEVPARAEAPREPASVEGRVKSRVTGEGIDAGPKITGDDWERGDRVTGTEGASAQRRNPTRRGGPMTAMAQLRAGTRNEELPEPVSKVTGSSGSTDSGALVTYSGGARG